MSTNNTSQECTQLWNEINRLLGDLLKANTAVNGKELIDEIHDRCKNTEDTEPNKQAWPVVLEEVKALKKNLTEYKDWKDKRISLYKSETTGAIGGGAAVGGIGAGLGLFPLLVKLIGKFK